LAYSPALDVTVADRPHNTGPHVRKVFRVIVNGVFRHLKLSAPVGIVFDQPASQPYVRGGSA